MTAVLESNSHARQFEVAAAWSTGRVFKHFQLEHGTFAVYRKLQRRPKTDMGRGVKNRCGDYVERSEESKKAKSSNVLPASRLALTCQ